MIIFSDFHHGALAHSFHLLFEKRLGHQLFFPTGMEWFYQGQWKIGDPYGPGARNTALQFLNGALPADGTGVVNVPHGITFDQFKETPIDLIIASYYDHIPVYKHLRDQYHPKAKLIFQMGNAWTLTPQDIALVDGVMASTSPFPFFGKPIIWYHQEFDTNLYCYSNEYRNPYQLASFTNALPLSDIYKPDWRDFQEVEETLGEMYLCRSFGGGCRNGSLDQETIAETMKSIAFGIHFKEGGDGYGYVIHQLAATGTPIIFKKHQYQGKLAEIFMEDGKTGFNVDDVGLGSVCERIKSASKEERDAMSLEIRRRFDEYVNFDEEQRRIEIFLNNLD